MHYRISCQCGKAVTVPETSAGTNIPCHCGRTIVVPSLRELRRQSGSRQEAVPPEMEIEALLLAGRLPEEHYCIVCGTNTDHFVNYRAECERAQVKNDGWPRWKWLLVFLTLGLLAVAGVVFSRQLFAEARGQTIERGKDRIFDLPLRICDQCRQHLTNEDDVKDAMWEVPVYRRLLEKYPDTKVFLPIT